MSEWPKHESSEKQPSGAWPVAITVDKQTWDELRAEVKHLQQALLDAARDVDKEHAEAERLRAEVALLRESVHLVQEIMDGLATKHSGCDCEWHRAWVVFDNAKEC